MAACRRSWSERRRTINLQLVARCCGGTHECPQRIAAGFSGLIAGALSMGAGEYVSVSSQADTERADLELERRAPERDNAAEHDELRDI